MPAAPELARPLTLGGALLGALARDARIGTPAYAYDLDGVAREARELRAAFEGKPHLVAYAVKANSAGPIVRALAAEGCGADVVSGAELLVATGAGIPPASIVYSGVAKTDDELALAIGTGDRGIGAVQLESAEEIERVAARARALGKKARVSVRVNPDVGLEELDTHAHIATGHDEAKFGIPLVDGAAAVDRVLALPELVLVGLTSHAGSQLTVTRGYVAAARALFEFTGSIRGRAPALAYVDAGGGFGIDYGEGCPARPMDFVREVRAEQERAGLGDLALYVEPGRSLVAAHGVLLARVIQPKVTRGRRWLMIDAGMNDLIRPALYGARHRIVPLDGEGGDLVEWRVVGPCCESSDDFGTHVLPAAPPWGVALLDAGAYGYTMASRYNGRPLPAEVFLKGGRIVAVRERKSRGAWVEERLGI
jgi:diaminopimelate decarboxylase